MSLRKRSNVPGFSRKSTMTTYPPIFFFLCMPIGLCDLIEMGAYGALRPVGITRDDGVIDRLMRPAGDELLTGRAQGRAPLLGQPGRDGLMDRGEDRIARNDRQHIVESDVGALEGVEIVERLEIGGESALELFEVFGGRVLSRIARQA